MRFRVAEYDPLVTVVGVIDALRSLEVAANRSTVSVKPMIGAMTTVAVVVDPALNVIGLGLTVIEKSGPTTVIGMYSG